jgi:hypothetical protein
VLQNDLNNPNRRVKDGDRFGYDYTINAVQVTGWLQNMITLPQWDINYGLKMQYTQFQRDGHMQRPRTRKLLRQRRDPPLRHRRIQGRRNLQGGRTQLRIGTCIVRDPLSPV